MKVPILRWQTAILIVVLVHVMSMLALSNLRIDNAPDAYYTPGSPALLIREKLRATFPTDEVLIVTFQGDDLYSADFLRRLQALVTRLEAHALVKRVSSITSIERISATSDGFEVGPLVDIKKLSGSSPEDVKRAVMGDRFAPGSLAARDGKLLAIVVQPNQLSDSGMRLALKIAVELAINDLGLRKHYAGDAGPITMDVAQLESVLDDTKRFVPITVLMSLGLMWWVVGRWRPMVIGAMAMSTVVTPTLALIALADKPYTMVTAMLPTLLAAYTSATLIHLYAAIQRGHASQLSRGRSLDNALANGLKPGLFNVITTAVGLLSLVFVPLPPIQVFGVAGSIGTLFVFVTVYFLAPPLLRHWDSQRWPISKSGLGKFGRIAPRLALFSVRHAGVVICAFVVLVLLTVPAVLRVEAESDLLAFFKPDHPVTLNTRMIESRLSGVSTVEILIEGDAADSLLTVARLRSIRELQTWLEAQPEIDRSVSFADLVEEMHFAMNGEDIRFRTLPPSDRLLQQYLLIYDGRELYDFVDRSFAKARIVLSLNVHGAKALSAVIERIQHRIETDPLPGLKLEVGGYGRLFADQSTTLLSGQAKSFASAFGQIFLFMLILWRSFSATCICMLPNLAPLYFVFVLMGALGIHLDTATVMIAGIVLGITMDDTIHLFHGWRHLRQRGASSAWAVARTFKSSGSAVMAISVLLISQFLLLATSDFRPTANFGLMTAVGLLSGQIFELLLTPALLHAWAQLAGKRKRTTALEDAIWEPTRLEPRRANETSDADRKIPP